MDNKGLRHEKTLQVFSNHRKPSRKRAPSYDRSAVVAELADAHGSGPCDSNILRVRLPSTAQKREVKNLCIGLFLGGFVLEYEIEYG